ncbi:MAG TPA: cellulase family glycosylhydrolase, partial [Paludibacteraceae bacterium]|nr:cellulase family glycosylhydrolase [Paludibacteraceae bacterium]
CTSSCKPEEVVQPELIVAKEEIPFTKNAGSILLAIKTNVKWRASSNESWCTLSPASGEAGSRQIAVWVTENTSVAVREAIITITAGSLSKQVKVIQAQKVVFTISQKEFNVPGQGGEITVTIQASQDFTTAIQAAWITQKSISADKKTQIFTVAENDLDSLREGTITFTSGSMTEIVSVRQTTKDFSIPPDKTGMDSDAKVLAKKMHLGWNLGNTLEAIGGETAWGNPKASKTLIDLVKASGFNAVRIPCAWDQYLENQTTYKIKDLWLARVKEVVDYCIENDMYAILNIHWDGGWLENNPTPDKQAEVNKKQKAIWEQIALYFRNYDERLLFAGTNEVHTTSGNPTQANFDVQMSYNQTFVDAVRFTGGKNAYRNLIIQAYNTNIDQAVAYLKISTDYVPDRLMVEVHHYDPWNFCGLEKDETWGKYAALWGQPYEQYAIGVLAGRAATWGKEDYLKTQFNKIKTSFVDKGYPVILGEYGVIRRTTYSGDALMHHLDSRAYYLRYVTEQAKNYGLIPFYWDNGSTGNLAFGIIDRKTNRIADEKALNALIEGSVAGTYPY